MSRHTTKMTKVKHLIIELDNYRSMPLKTGEAHTVIECRPTIPIHENKIIGQLNPEARSHCICPTLDCSGVLSRGSVFSSLVGALISDSIKETHPLYHLLSPSPSPCCVPFECDTLPPSVTAYTVLYIQYVIDPGSGSIP